MGLGKEGRVEDGDGVDGWMEESELNWRREKEGKKEKREKLRERRKSSRLGWG
jgi:hypothetical protein